MVSLDRAAGRNAVHRASQKLFKNSESRKGAEWDECILIPFKGMLHSLPANSPERGWKRSCVAGEIVWGYMVKRLSAYGGCLGGNRR